MRIMPLLVLKLENAKKSRVCLPCHGSTPLCKPSGDRQDISGSLPTMVILESRAASEREGRGCGEFP